MYKLLNTILSRNIFKISLHWICVTQRRIKQYRQHEENVHKTSATQVLKSTAQIRLESLPKMNLLVQSDTTNTLVRQLTCLLNIKNYNKMRNNTAIFNQLSKRLLPRIYRIPEPLSAVTHGNPVPWQFGCSLLSPERSELPEMLVPCHRSNHKICCFAMLLLTYTKWWESKQKTYWKGRNWWRPEPLNCRGPSGISVQWSLRLKHLERYEPCWAATWDQKDKMNTTVMYDQREIWPRQIFPVEKMKVGINLSSCR